MCSAHDDCEECPLRAEPFTYGDCATAISKHYQECVRRIDNWCKEHPVKTYAQDFFEKFPNAVYKQGRNNKYPAKCRNYFYANCKGGVRDESNCDGGCEYCWNEECEE